MPLNKLAIERAQTRLNGRISSILNHWEKQNPPPCEKMSNFQIAEIAFSDPLWKRNALAAIKCGDSWRCSDQLRQMSPKANAACVKNDKQRSDWKDLRDSKERALRFSADKLLDRLVIGGMSPDDFIKAIDTINL